MAKADGVIDRSTSIATTQLLVFAYAALTVVILTACAPGEPSPQANSIPPSLTISIEYEDDSPPSSELADVATSAETWTVVANVESAIITVLAEPAAGAAVIAELTSPTPIGGPLVFRVVGTEANLDKDWLEVHLPVRPNGTTGWVRRDQVSLSSNPYRIAVDVNKHQLQVFKDDELWLDAPVAIGTGDTPTPIGEFYIIELMQPPNSEGPYGTYAFGLSGFSETLTNFAGGDGVIGLHGTNDPSALGSDVSHGCVRLANEVISELAGVLPLGTPVVIG